LDVVSQSKVLPLELIASGEWAEVEQISGAPGWVMRLAEMGVRCGSRLRVLRQGMPCLLEVGSARLSVRTDPETLILVRPVAS
jgi:Fe2+ transport system protein FeoA